MLSSDHPCWMQSRNDDILDFIPADCCQLLYTEMLSAPQRPAFWYFLKVLVLVFVSL